MFNEIHCGDSTSVLKNIESDTIDLTVTSPPYDDLRDYKGFIFNSRTLATQLFRVTAPGGVVVWVVGDSVTNGSESCTSFKQAMYFVGTGFNLHDTMIYQKRSPLPANMEHKRYASEFEYMFVLSKGRPKTFNPIMEKSVHGGKMMVRGYREKDGTVRKVETGVKEEKIKGNVWCYDAGWMKSTQDVIAFEHPAIFPERIARDHIITWTNEGDIVLDPMCGSGTTCKVARALGRGYIGIDISPEYCELAGKRLAQCVISF